MGTLRTPETEAKYDAVKASGVMQKTCALCDDRTTLKDFTYWRVVENAFPYDQVAKTHHMAVLKRHAPIEELTANEHAEWEDIKHGYVFATYEFIIEPVPKQRSIPAHAHLHFIVAKGVEQQSA